MDRFSHLPEELSHHILSDLDMTELTRFGSLSKRCRGLHFSTPTLKLVPDLNIYSSEQKLLDYMNSLDRFLIQRGDTRMQKLHINWTWYSQNNKTLEFLDGELSKMAQWIKYAVRCKVEELDLEFQTEVLDPIGMEEGSTWETALEFPSCVLLSESLKFLSVQEDYTIIKTPVSTSRSNLVCLRLKYVTIDDDFCQWVSCSCKFLKELRFETVDGVQNMTIESSSLESFEILQDGEELKRISICGEKLKHVDVFWNSDSTGKSAAIYAPNVKYLSWGGNIMNNLHLGEFLHVEKAALRLKVGVYDDMTVYNFLCRVRMAKSLGLCGWSMKLVKKLYKAGMMPIQFPDVCLLRIYVVNSIEDELVHTLVSLFRGMPKLETLCIRAGRPPYEIPEDENQFGPVNKTLFDKRYWERQNLAFVSGLKKLTIDLRTGLNGVKLAAYLLENARNLKDMSIKCYAGEVNFLRLLSKESKVIADQILPLFYQNKEDENEHRILEQKWFDCLGDM